MTLDAAKAGQVSGSAAEIYDQYFVPALFGAWAGPLCDAAQVGAGARVLDIACGTGATTRAAAQRAGAGGRTVGLDRNAEMLSVARPQGAGIEWVEAMAEELPFANASFDAVLCQYGLMFFDDRTKGLKEMQRVLRPNGHLALSVWDDVAQSPGYARMIALIERMFGTAPADALRAPFVLGDKRALFQVLSDAGLEGAKVETIEGRAQFSSIRQWVTLDVRGWTLSEFIDEAGFEALVEAAEDKLAQFVGADGKVGFPAPAHIVSWTKG